MALSPIATGILMGSLSGAMAGLPAAVGTGGGSIAAGAAIGGIAGGLAAGKAEDDKREAFKVQEQEKANGIKNQNALVQQEYNKKKQARGLGDSTGNNTQSGAVMAPSGNTNILG